MTILCGSDFSESSSRAALVAAQLAARMQVDLHLCHALAGWWVGEVDVEEQATLVEFKRRELEEQAVTLSREGATVHVRVESDTAEKSLLHVAQQISAQLLIFGATGRDETAGRPVGSTADRLAQRSHIPSLVVRRVEPFQAWLARDRPLKVLVGVDFDLVSDEAWQWAQNLGHIAPIELIGAHIYSPPEMFQKFGLGGARSYIDGDPEIDRMLRREIETRFPGGSRQNLKASLGRIADQLLFIAEAEQADVVVVGTHHKSAIARLWESTVSRGVLHASAVSVACVPLSSDPLARAAPKTKTVLAATDFSPIGDAAIEHAFGQVGPGGKVYIVHVIKPLEGRSLVRPWDVFVVSKANGEHQALAAERLRSLMQTQLTSNGKTSEGLVLESFDVASAIAQAADRLGVDVICLGTHGRTGIASTVFGSIARSVMTKTQRPVLVVRAPKE